MKLRPCSDKSLPNGSLRHIEACRHSGAVLSVEIIKDEYFTVVWWELLDRIMKTFAEKTVAAKGRNRGFFQQRLRLFATTVKIDALATRNLQQPCLGMLRLAKRRFPSNRLHENRLHDILRVVMIPRMSQTDREHRPGVALEQHLGHNGSESARLRSAVARIRAHSYYRHRRRRRNGVDCDTARRFSMGFFTTHRLVPADLSKGGSGSTPLRCGCRNSIEGRQVALGFRWKGGR